MHTRIEVLELALAQSHAHATSDPHPLLTEGYSFSSPAIDRALPYPRPGNLTGAGARQNSDDVVDSAFGTLTIGTEGRAKFVGSFAGSEYLRENANELGGGMVVEDGGARVGENGAQTEPRDSQQLVMSTHNYHQGFPTPPPSANNLLNGSGNFSINQQARDGYSILRQPMISPYAAGGIALSDSFIAGGVGAMYDLEALRRELPDWQSEGKALCESYWENVNWM